MKIKSAIAITLGLLFTLTAQGADSSAISAEKRCTPPAANEEVVYSSDFKWGMTLEDMKVKFEEMYQSGKRLKARAFFNGKDFVLPVEGYGRETTYARITKKFIHNVKDHIEQGLKNGYVNYIFFPDMGHSHLFIPEKFYEEELANIPASERALLYEKMLSHENVKILYHTAEQLDMVDDNGQIHDDRVTQWRFFTRNLVGYNNNSKRIELIHEKDHRHNTARGYKDGYRYWGAGYNITATSKGCFSYLHQGKTFYFDISLEDLAPRSSSTGGGFDF